MSYSKQSIGNRGAVKPRPDAHTHVNAQTRNYTQGSDFFGDDFYSGYPGLGGGQYPAQFQGQIKPYGQSQNGGGLSSLFGGSGSSAGGSAGFNFAQLKSMIDRLGGVEAIVDTFGKMQRMVASISQMAPMLKLLFSSFAKGKTAAPAEEVAAASVRKRRRRRRGPVSVRSKKTRR